MNIFSFIINFITNSVFINKGNNTINKNRILNNINNINISSISYELLYRQNIFLKIKLKVIDKIPYNISFIAFIKSEDELNEYTIDCSNKSNKLFVCFSEKNILLNNNKNYYFYYDKQKSRSNLTLNGKDIYKADKNVSLIFHPVIPNHQIVYSNKIFHIENNDNMVSSGYLYIIRKSKRILKEPRNGFNKYIELNHYIPRCGLGIYMPPCSLVAYKEAIRRGYKMVDADILFTKDKIPVISHDIGLKGISNGKGYIIHKTIEELEKLDFGIKFGKQYIGEKILKFDDLLKLCKNNNIIIDLDLGHLKYH